MKYELKISQAAEMLGVTESRISQLVSSGMLDSVTYNGRRRISRESVERYRDHVRRVGRPPMRSEEAIDYILMNGDYEVMRLVYDPASDHPLAGSDVFDPARAPWGTVTRGGAVKRRELNAWWRSRAIPDVRPGLDSKLAELRLSEASQIPFRNFGLSLSDCYWVRRADGADEVEWHDINYFENSFGEAPAAEWDYWLSNVGLDSPDNTSEGALPKKWVVVDGTRFLLKGCRVDDQRPCNEVVATALHRRLLQPADYVPYELVQTADGLACRCANFLRGREEYIPASSLMDTVGNTRGSSFFDRFCRYVGRLGVDERLFREHMSKMIACDTILANADRHRRNFGLIRDIDTLELRVAPLFDTGNCLWYWKSDREVGLHDWSFSSKPFGPQFEAQLALVDYAGWFDEAALTGFVDEALTTLSSSVHASAPSRLDFIAEGLREQIRVVSQIMRVLAYRA